MPAIILSLKDLIWFLRAILLSVFGVGVYLETQGIAFFNGLAQDHITTSSTLIFLSVMGFVQPFIKIKTKTEGGGEIVQKKFTAVIGILVAIICVILYLSVFHHELLLSALIGIGGGIGGTIINSVYGFGNLLQTPLIGYGAGLLTMGIVAIAVDRVVWPRIHKEKQEVLPLSSSQQGLGQFAPGGNIQRTTPELQPKTTIKEEEK